MAGLIKRLLGRLFPPAAHDSNRTLGRRGEALTARYLRRHGYRLLARNLRAGGVEVDLVALDGPTLVFIEVKARRSMAAGAPQEAVDWRKQRRLRQAAAAFARTRSLSHRPIRFDVVAIDARGRRWGLEVIKDAF
jgi:putative endonuclease